MAAFCGNYLQTVSRLSCVLAVLLVLAWPVVAPARDVVRLVTGDYPPYSGEALPGGGYVTQIVRRVFDEMDMPVEIHFLPWKRGFARMAEGQYDGTFPYLLNDVRGPKVFAGRPLIHWDSHIFWKLGRQVPVEEIGQDIAALECLPLGYAGIALTDQLLQEGRLERFQPPKAQSCWLMVAHGRADFIIEDLLVAEIALGGMAGDLAGEIDISEERVSRDAGYLFFSRATPDGRALRDSFDAALNHLDSQGEILKLRALYVAAFPAKIN